MLFSALINTAGKSLAPVSLFHPWRKAFLLYCIHLMQTECTGKLVLDVGPVRLPHIIALGLCVCLQCDHHIVKSLGAISKYFL